MSAAVYRLRITLVESDPGISRTIEVPGAMDLQKLHAVIQTVMGWQNSHLFEFEADGKRYSEVDADTLDWAPDTIPAEQARLNDVASEAGAVFTYLYDFGDSWEHEILVEEIAREDEDEHYPPVRCLSAERACPPEDSGGVWGYQEMLAVLRDPKHEDYEHFADWIGPGFDPEAVELKAINRELGRLQSFLATS